MMARAMLVVMVLAGVAHADKASSIEHYNKGRKAYAAASFDVAVAEFESAYHEFPAPEYLHDIGQAYRRLEKCDALGYFERYLAAKPDAKNRADVEKTIATLRPKCGPAAATAVPASTAPATMAPATTPTKTAPTTTALAPARPAPTRPAPAQTPSPTTSSIATTSPPPGTAIASTVARPSNASTATSVTTVAPRESRSPFSANASASFVLLDAGPVVMPPIGQLDVGARYRLLDRQVTLEVGAGLSLARLPFDDSAMGTAWLVTPEITAEARYRLYPRLWAIANAGAGPMVVSGLDAGNPFTEGGMESGSIAMVRLHGGVGVAWDATDRVRVHFAPGYQWSPRREPLASDISALHGLALSAGVTVGW